MAVVQVIPAGTGFLAAVQPMPSARSEPRAAPRIHVVTRVFMLKSLQGTGPDCRGCSRAIHAKSRVRFEIAGPTRALLPIIGTAYERRSIMSSCHFCGTALELKMRIVKDTECPSCQRD